MSVNNDSFVVEQEDILLAQEVCNSVDDKIRNRAVANVVASNIAKRYFQDLDVDTDSGIHNIPQVLKNIDISDIYINGNYIDVRLYFNDNELGVPRVHNDLGIMPVAYMFIKLNEDLSQGSVAGFVFPEDIDKNNCVNDYYEVNEDSLRSYYDLESRLATVDDEDFGIDFEKDVYSFLDEKLSDIRNFYQILIASKPAREYLKNAARAHFVFCSMPESDKNTSETVLQDSEIGFDESDTNLLFEEDDSESNESEMLEIFEPFDSVDENLEMIEDQDSLVVEVLPDEPETLDLFNEDLTEPFDMSGETADEEPDEITALDGSYSDAIQVENPSEGILPLDVAEETQDEDPLGSFIEEEVNQNQIIEETESSTSFENMDGFAESESNEIVSAEEGINTVESSELSEPNYSTQAVPSLDTIEFEEELPAETITEQMIVNSEKNADAGSQTSYDTNENEQQIQKLFEDNSRGTVNVSKKKGSPVTTLGLLVLLGAVGYFGYTKYFNQLPAINPPVEPSVENQSVVNVAEKEQSKEDAMPIETVENTEIKKPTEDPSSSTISAIEQNLNASIEVSRLAVNWEVPVSYANNATAKRYFVKLGKVLQLNLKTELLLLSSPPITDKMAIELEFNKESGRFTISKVVSSSGVDVVDGVVKDTVNKALGMNMSMNMSVFSNLQGNPVLIIKL